MSEKFKVKKVTDLNKVDENTEFPTSDFATLTVDNKFVQLEYIESENKLEPYKVKPGIWAIQKTMAGLHLYETSFTSDAVLESFVQTKNVTDKIDCFFKKFHVYKENGIEIPIRRMLLYGPAGTGKSTSISLACKKYAADNKTAILIWHTDKFEAYAVKDFIKSFAYDGVEKMILVAEDLGGSEQSDSPRGSESSLLSLLDNQEKTFTIPTMIIATSNNPERFMGNLTNRPGRFSDKIKVDFPSGDARKQLLKFFARNRELSTEVSDRISKDDCKEFTADHLKEIFLRADLYDLTLMEVIKQLSAEIIEFNKGFTGKSNKMGFHQDGY